MKKIYFTSLLFLFILGQGYSQGQSVYSRSEVYATDWWNNSYPWYYSNWGNNQVRPDEGTRNNVFIGHSSYALMNVNGAYFNLRTLTIESSSTPNRTFTSFSGGGISLSFGLYNQSTASHTFNVPIGIDASTVVFGNTAGGSLSFSSSIFTNNNTLQFNGGNFTVSGVIGGGDGTGKIIKSSSGTLALTAQNTYTGLTTVEEGTLQLNRTGGTTIPITNNVSVSDGATLRISSNQTLNDLTLNGTLVIDSGATLTIKGTLLAGSAATLTTTGTLIIDSGATLNITGTYTNSTGNILIKNNANVLQTSTSANTGSLIVNRNSASIQLYDYTLWSSPVASQQLQAFSPSTLASRFYTYNSSTDQYNAVASTTNFALGTGYLIRAPNNWLAGATATPFEAQFTGVPNNGTVILTSLTSNKYYAVGNPYPSTISADSFLNPNANSTDGTLYFWRKTNGASGSAYATYTLAGGTGTAPNGGITPNGTIQVGQGFIVKATSTSLTFNNTMRTANVANQFLKTTEEKSRFWLNLSSTTGFVCQTMVAYMPEATSGVDNAIDGLYFNDSQTALTSIIDQSEYTIQGKPLPFDTNDTVPLGFKTNAAGNFTIGIDHVDGLFSNGQIIYLKDNLANTTVNLSEGAYTFASEVGVFNSRFEIVYQSALALPTFTANNVVVYSQNGDITINSGKTPMDQVRIFDIRGCLLAERSGVHATEIKLNIGAQNQVLLVKITAENGSIVTKKIIQ